METNWVKSQLLPEILLPTTPLLLRDMTSRKKNKKTHQRSVNTGDGDYWLVIADLIVSLSQKGKKKKKKAAWRKPYRYHNHTGWHPACHLRGSISSKHNVSLLFSIWDAESVISRCAPRTLKCKGVGSRRWKAHSPGFSPLRHSDLKWTGAKLSKLKISLVGHATVWCTHWKINPVRIHLQCRWVSKRYRRLIKRVLFFRTQSLCQVYLPEICYVFCVCVCCGGAHLHCNCGWETRPRQTLRARRKSIWWNHGAVKLLVPVYTLSPSSLHHVWSDRCAPHLCNVPTRFIIQSWQASSINKKKQKKNCGLLFLFFAAGSHQDGSQPHGNSTSQGTAQQILHMARTREQKRETVCHSGLFFFFFLAAHTPQSVPHAVARRKAVCELELMDGSEPSLRLLWDYGHVGGWRGEGGNTCDHIHYQVEITQLDR